MLTLGTEVSFSRKLGLAVEGGIKFADRWGTENTTIPPNGFTLRSEIKFHNLFPTMYKEVKYNERSGRLKSFLVDYIGLEYRYIYDQTNNSDECYEKGELVVDYYGQIWNIYIGSIKYGFMIYWGRTFYMDFYLGAGARYREIINIERKYTERIDDDSGWRGNLSLGFKVGVSF